MIMGSYKYLGEILYIALPVYDLVKVLNGLKIE